MNPIRCSRHVLVACALLVAATAAAQTKYTVTATAEKGVDFTRFKTYSWTAGRPSPDSTIDRQITAAVDRELGALGMTKAPSGPGDVIVSYDSVSRTDVDVNAKPDAGGLRPEKTVGSLVVALLHPQSRKAVLRLRVDRPIVASTTHLEETIDAVVADLFAKYPARAR